MGLQSKLFAGDSRLEACAVSDPSHVTPGTVGSFVGKIQQALIQVDGAKIDAGEISANRYGPSTTQAVRKFKTSRNLLNYAGKIDDITGKKTITTLDAELARLPPPIPEKPRVFIAHDVRLFGWRPAGDVLEVNGDTPLQWVIDNVVKRGKECDGNLVFKIMAHGLPGFVQFARGRYLHPTLPESVTDPAKGNLYIGPGKGGICRTDLTDLEQLKGFVKRIEFHSCLVARIGPCYEANGHVCYDGNEFCYQLAQRTGAEVKASIHLQYYWTGEGGPAPSHQMHFGGWNGLVFTWGPDGSIIDRQPYPYTDKGTVPPPKDSVQTARVF